MRKCKWCGEMYDPAKGSSIWCEKNPQRGKGAERRKPRLFTMLMLPSDVSRAEAALAAIGQTPAGTEK